MISEISIEHTFDAGHRIVGHKGKCARLHGHTYKIHVLARGEVHDPGFVVDFGDVKDLINQWDHRMLLWDNDPLLMKVFENATSEFCSSLGIQIVEFNPTAENMVQYLANEIQSTFALTTVFCELWETPKASARFQA